MHTALKCKGQTEGFAEEGTQGSLEVGLLVEGASGLGFLECLSFSTSE